MGITPDDPFWIVCKSCGKDYTLLLATVCPNCFAWPKREQVQECQKKPARARVTNPDPRKEEK